MAGPSKLKPVVAPFARRIPLGWVGAMSAFPSRSLARRLAWLAVQGREVRVPRGMGRGLRIRGGVPTWSYMFGDAELPVQRALALHVQSAGVYYDVGANVGFFTMLGARRTGSAGSVVAFEPAPENAALLRHHVDLNGFEHVEVLQVAVADEPRREKLFLARHPGGHALASAGVPPDFRGTTSVDVVTIDEVVATGRRPPTFVKIDVEGGELAVLRGMRRTMREHHPIILCEIDDGDREAFSRKKQAVESLLRRADYSVTSLPPAYPNQSWFVEHLLGVY